MQHLEIRETKTKGRGVFATKDFTPGEIIETCPVIELPEQNVGHIDKTKLYDYYFGWGTSLKGAAMALGYGSLYNHSYEPNAQYEKDFERNVVIFTCLRPIKKDEEITVNYNGNPYSKTPVWFEVGNQE